MVALRAVKNATLFTRDAGFYRWELRHRAYCIAVMTIGQHEVAKFVRRFLRHPDFNSRGKRMGKIVRISATKITSRKIRDVTERHAEWD